MKIGILYICIGKYNIFWKDFYLSCEQNFLPEAEKHYFVFTDSSEIEFENDSKNITRVYQENLGWPNNTLLRYEIFLKSKDIIENMDYLFYLNANLQFLTSITAKEFLPQNQEKIVGCLHPGYYNKPISKYTFENNSLSKAFLEKKEDMHYFAGGINGGKTKEFLEAINIINKNIKEDSKKNITAIWHDESHWNWYLNNHLNIVKTISPSYLYPENSNLPFKEKIKVRNKELIGGHSNFRNKIELRLVINKIKDSIKKILKKVTPTKIVKIQGGLGNQLFQYAYGRELELTGRKIIFDISFYSNNRSDTDSARSIKLDDFNIQTKVKFTSDNHIIPNLIGKIKRKLGFKQEGFFQSEKYFKGIKDIILNEFTLKKQLNNKLSNIIKQIENTSSVSIHIRRGDYVNDKKTNKFHGTCDINYYSKAIDIIKAQENNPTFFVFSDDIDWVSKNINIPNPVYLVSSLGGEDYEELVLMSKCKHNIIANSSFSWWGAWLNQNLDKIVVAPKQWFKNVTSNELNILPEEWTKI